MFSKLLSTFKGYLNDTPIKSDSDLGKSKVVFYDGDAYIKGSTVGLMWRFKNENYECHMVRAGSCPKDIGRSHVSKWLKFHSCEGYRTGKEATDKYIIALAQKRISQGGVDRIIFISDDRDFMDMLKMLRQINPEVKMELWHSRVSDRLSKFTIRVF